jgi:hypothetical protein
MDMDLISCNMEIMVVTIGLKVKKTKDQRPEA